MTRRRTLLISAPRGSGGSYAHLSRVVIHLRQFMPEWQLELHAPLDVLRTCFGTDREPWMRPLIGTGYLARLQWEFLTLPRRLRDDPHALVWAPFGPPLNLALADRTVWMSRNILPLLPQTELEVSAADRLRIRALRSLVIRWARSALGTVCVSKHARDRLSILSGVPSTDISVIPHGIDPRPPGTRCSSDALERLRLSPYILHVGQPVPYRKTRELCDALVLLAGRHPESPQMLLVGKARQADRDYERACAAALAPLQSTGRATLLGQLKHSDTLMLLSHAHTFVYPSIHEDCPNVVLEALGAHCVSVYSDIPAVRELVDTAAVLVRHPDAPALAAALERAVFDERLRRQLRAAASARVGAYTWVRTAELTAVALERAAAGPNTHSIPPVPGLHDRP